MQLSMFQLSEQPVNDFIPCALQISIPQITLKIPMHLTLLIDVSESMADERRLENVIKCVKLILAVLSESDKISLITFGDASQIHFNEVPLTQTNKVMLEEKIASLKIDGCTNLSAGIANVGKVLSSMNTETKVLKQGLLILTDGHANRGVISAPAIEGLLQNLQRAIEGLSIYTVGYGNSHNAKMLKSIAESLHGTYSVVNCIEDTAFAFGDTLGGLMSCAYQNTMLLLPKNTEIKGPLGKMTRNKSTRYSHLEEVSYGDLFAGTSPMVLLNIPKAEFAVHAETPCFYVSGVSLPGLKEENYSCPIQLLTTRNIDIEMTCLRYECSELLESLAKSQDTTMIKERLEDFEKRVNDEFYKNNPVQKSLLEEIVLMKKTIQNLLNFGYTENATVTQLIQHTTVMATASGFSSPSAPRRRNPRASSPHAEEQVEDPTAAFQNVDQARLSALMRTMSQNPN